MARRDIIQYVGTFRERGAGAPDVGKGEEIEVGESGALGLRPGLEA